ncbi:hypothetical protein SAMN05192561_10972 [Halopenitus malekzadehii]|uniref:Uncharacterized protein n=2 Tax=Halopenitus malekzadehii TaxID=1267564 RepID=A0A1H6J9X7_9EURY|nr:hypothetical protein SAMN05192561_10972 [Halopenitus malekzadehii]
MGETRSSANFTDENNNKTEYVNLTTSLPAGEYTIGASASDTADNSNSTTGLGDGFDVDLGVSLDPDTVVANQETTVDVTLSNAPSGDVNYALLDDGTNLRTTGSTSGDTFSVTDTFDTGNNFTVAVSPDIDAVDLTYSNNDGASNVSVEDRNLVENYNVDPANPQYNGSATVSGTLVNSSTGDPVTSTTVQLNDTETRTLLDVDTTGGQDGTFELSTDRFPDATTYEVVDTSDGSTVETVDVGAADATVSLETEGNNQGGFDENYTVTAQSDTGAELSNFTTAGTPGNYLNVTGPFDGEVTGDNLQTGNLLNSNYNNSEGITNYSSR